MPALADDEQTNTKQRILDRLVKQAVRHRESWLATGEEINSYAFLKDEAPKDGLWAETIPFQAKLSKGFEFVALVTSQLYQRNPERRVEPTPWAAADPRSLARAKMMQDYLNYIVVENGLEKHSKRTVVEACIFGKGVMWTGWNPRKKMIQTVSDTVRNFLQDPDARVAEERNWVGRIRCKPRWWMLKHYPEARETILGLPASAQRPSDGDRMSGDFTTDMIRYYELYFRIGLTNYRDGRELMEESQGADGARSATGDDSPRKYILAEGGKLLQETDWEVPTYLDDKWPCTELDFYERPNLLWPMSPLEAGLPHLKALNFIYRASLAKMTQSVKTFIIEMVENGEGVGEENMVKIQNVTSEDGLFETLRVQVNGTEGKRIGDMIQQFNLKSGVEEFEKYFALISAEFEKATGLYSILYTGDAGRQLRSAREVDFREEHTKSRSDDMRDRVEGWASEVAALEALYARFLCEPEDIAPILGPQAAQAWGFIMPAVKDEAERLAAQYQQQGAPPEIAEQLAQMQAQMQAEEQEAQGGVEFKAWIMETDYSIVSGSTRRRDIEQEIDTYKEADNQLLPVMLQNPNPVIQSIAMRIKARQFKVIGAPPELVADIEEVARLLATPPPPPAPMPGEESPADGPPPGVGSVAPPGGP